MRMKRYVVEYHYHDYTIWYEEENVKMNRFLYNGGKLRCSNGGTQAMRAPDSFVMIFWYRTKIERYGFAGNLHIQYEPWFIGIWISAKFRIFGAWKIFSERAAVFTFALVWSIQCTPHTYTSTHTHKQQSSNLFFPSNPDKRSLKEPDIIISTEHTFPRWKKRERESASGKMQRMN